MTAYIAVMFTLVVAALTMLGVISLDTFTVLWQGAFVLAVKAAVFAMIPGGFILGVLACQD